MASVLNLYLDDSGTRHPTRDPGKHPQHGHDWFAFGGVMICDEDEPAARDLHLAFCTRWDIALPLHSSEIRAQGENFRWIRSLASTDRDRFYEELYQLMRDVPVIGIAAVVDRQGYNTRYLEQYQRQPWQLCKTAFSVVVERAAKFARTNDRRLRVAPERCNKTEDALARSYYDALRTDGMPFAVHTSEQYHPLSADQFRETLYEFRTKFKSSPMAQLADLFLWPICMGGYHASNRTYARLMADGKLIECKLPSEAWPMLGSKYSCFENVVRKP